jgi:hypothetical protein
VLRHCAKALQSINSTELPGSPGNGVLAPTDPCYSCGLPHNVENVQHGRAAYCCGDRFFLSAQLFHIKRAMFLLGAISAACTAGDWGQAHLAEYQK